MSGNEALAEAAIMAGLDAFFGYPITPQSEIGEYMSKRMPELGRVFVQSESELAAINMVYGAAATGARAMTSSSSPGVSLMQEGISYLAGAELPAVIVNIMRGGPGLGNISPSQSDYFQATRGGGHGDYHCIVLGPSTVQELADSMPLAFDLADEYRTPVMVLGDGIMGQMMEPVEFRIKTTRRLPAKDWALTGAQGRDPRVVRSLMIEDMQLERHNLHLQEKYARIQEREVIYQQGFTEDARIVLVAYGLMGRVAQAAVDCCRAEGIKAGWFRPISLWPFPTEPISTLARPKNREFLVIEMSHGQMLDDVRLAVNGQAPVKFYGRAGGGVPTVEQVMERIHQIVGSN